MKKIGIISFVIILSLIMILFVYNYCTKQDHSFSTYTLTNEEINLIQNGDIILRHGYGLASDIIVKTLNEKYDISHCAIICKNGNQINVIHSVSQSLSDFDGLQSQTLKRFICDSKENSIIVVRFKNQKNNGNEVLAKRAAYYLSKKLPFDNDFNLNDSSRIYCTELIWRVIKDGYNLDILKNQQRAEDKRNNYRFSFLWDTTYFQIVINHHLR
ncbi:MAG: YiiX/YebB-like N1pC/P60 family cysteine hydrolase [Bacteroidales bacterium]